MNHYIIEDTQRLEELTEWCRNRPEEAAVRIMNAEGLSEKIPSSPPEPLNLPLWVLEMAEHTKNKNGLIWKLPTTYRFVPKNSCDISAFMNSWMDQKPVMIGSDQVILKDFCENGIGDVEFFGEVVVTV